MNYEIVFPNTCEVGFKGKKPIDSWMKDWPLDQRLDKFFEFCRVWDDREDPLLKQEYQIFSHRLHWDEHPYCYEFKEVDSNLYRMFYTLVFSFTNEHWGTITKLKNFGRDATREHFKNHRHARNDLFQIYYPKNTVVKDWILDGLWKAAMDTKYLLNDVEEGKHRRYTMMEFAKKLEAYFKEHQGFRSPLYPCKNTARYVAMTWPHLVDPESVLFGGTGHFDGLHQIFGGSNLNGKVQYEIGVEGEFIPTNKAGDLWMEQMDILAKDPRNPMIRQKWLNCEDKTCFFWKSISIHHGAKKPTKNIPYTWIFSDSFNLSNRPEFLQEIIDRGLMYETEK
jgi:hypothetical protein